MELSEEASRWPTPGHGKEVGGFQAAVPGEGWESCLFWLCGVGIMNAPERMEVYPVDGV